MAKITDDGSRKRNSAYKSTKGWNDPEKAKEAGPNETYIPERDVYVFKPSKRYRIEIRATGTTPEMTEDFLKKIKKNFAEENFRIPDENTPVAIRFHLHFTYPGPEKRQKYARKGWFYPSGVDLRAWSDFIYDGLQGTLYEKRSQIVCSGEECMYSDIPGIAIEAFILWDFVDRIQK